MPTREELIKQAEAKWNRDQLIQQAEAKWQRENAPVQDDSFDIGQKAAQTFRSGVEGLTMGLSEPVVSGLMAVQQNLKKAAQESGGLAEFVKKATDPERVKREYQADVSTRRKFEQEEPGLAVGGELAGGLAPLALTGGASAIARGAQVLPELFTAGGKAVSTGVRALPGATKVLGSKGVIGSAARIGEQALIGGAQAMGAQALKQAVQEPTGFTKEGEMPSIGEAGAFGAKFGGGIASLPEIAAQSARFGKFAARVFTGVRGRDIDYYMANQKAVQNAPSLETIKDQVDNTVLKLNDDVDSAKLSVDQARSILKNSEEKLDDAIRSNKNLTGQQKADARIALKAAQRDFDLAWKSKVSDIKSARIPIQPDDVLDSVEAVKRQVSDLSEESYKILQDYNGKFDISGIPKQITKIQNQLKVGGKLLSKDSEAAFNTLERWKGNISGNGFVNGPDVKRIIQEVDSDLRLAGDRMAGEFSDKTYNSLLEMRRMLDEKIKDKVPFYKEVMQDVAALNLLRGELSKTFGRRESVISKLARIDNPNLSREKDLLSQLGELTGKDFKTPISEFSQLKAQGRTQIAQEATKQGLPEYQQLQKAQRAEGMTRSPQFGQAQALAIAEKGPEAQAVRSAQKLLELSQEKLTGAKESLAPYKSIGPKNSETFVKRLMSDKQSNVELRKLAKSLSELSDTDFESMVNALRTKESFEKTITQGSKNVNAWAILGAVVGFFSGGLETSLTTGGAGAILGQITDQYGPRMTRSVLDGMLKLKSNPTIQTVNEAFSSVPPELRERLKSDFIRLTTNYNNSSAIDRRMSDIEKR